MSLQFNDIIHIFYPQSGNQYYTEFNAIIIAWKWLIDVCIDNVGRSFKQEIRALLSTNSGDVHRIANIIRRVILLKKSCYEHENYYISVSEYAQSSIDVLRNQQNNNNNFLR
jgi:hypothetical protein